MKFGTFFRLRVSHAYRFWNNHRFVETCIAKCCAVLHTNVGSSPSSMILKLRKQLPTDGDRDEMLMVRHQECASKVHHQSNSCELSFGLSTHHDDLYA